MPPTAMVAAAGLTATDATDTGVTVTVDVPLFPSLVAAIVAKPAVRPVTRPFVPTAATAVLLLDQVTTRPVSVLPVESFVTAASCWVLPTLMLADAGLSVTEATGTLDTVIVALALLPSLAAVTVAEPTALAVTRPLSFTAAIAAGPLHPPTEGPAYPPPPGSRSRA